MTNFSTQLTLVEMQGLKQAMTEDRIFKFVLVLATYVIFIYINIVMLLTLRTKAMFCQTARYILFGHMLFNDTLHLVMSLLMYILSFFYLMIVRAACAIIVLLSAVTFYNAPLNLAVMSLERYTAICFPLRHIELATPSRAMKAVVVVWVLGLIDILIDVCALFLLAEPSYYLSPSVCTLEQLLVKPWQGDKSLAFKSLLFIMVAGVLLYTYVSIMCQARAISTDSSSAQKAMRTLLLHGVQLSLSLISFLYMQVELLLAKLPLSIYFHLRFLNFLVVLVLPRCLSSLIYGLRDETFRPLFKQNFLYCCTKFGSSPLSMKH